MKLSDKRAKQLFSAVADPIMDLRISYCKAKPLTAEQLDDELFKLQFQQWSLIKRALNYD